jgi:hypothetical protein
MVKLPKGGMTAEALMALLEADPEWVRQRDERDARHAAEVARLHAEVEPEAAPFRREIAAEAGLSIGSVWDMVKMAAPYPKAIPVLLRHLRSSRHPIQREGIARALTVQEAEGIASGPILEELKRETNHHVRWAMANTLTIVAVPADGDAIAALVHDPDFADVRERLTQALSNIRPASGRRPRSWRTRLGVGRGGVKHGEP